MMFSFGFVGLTCLLAASVAGPSRRAFAAGQPSAAASGAVDSAAIASESAAERLAARGPSAVGVGWAARVAASRPARAWSDLRSVHLARTLRHPLPAAS